MASKLLTIPENSREVFGLFSASIVDKPEHFTKAWEVLLRHSDRAMLTVLVSALAQDLVYTSICYLPKKVQPKVSKYLAENPAIREKVLNELREHQEYLRHAVKKQVAAGNKEFSGLRVVA